ncbi:hypothetical protein [Pseudoxanthomonas beigongshangi]
MRLDDLAKVIRDLEDALVLVGVSRAAAHRAAMDAESVSVADMLETQEDIRLLDLFEKVGCVTLAERQGVSSRTIYNRREEAIERLQLKKVCRFTSDNGSQEAA